MTINSSSTTSTSEGRGEIVIINSASSIGPLVFLGRLHARLRLRSFPKSLNPLTLMLSRGTGSGGEGGEFTKHEEILGDGRKKKFSFRKNSI